MVDPGDRVVLDDRSRPGASSSDKDPTELVFVSTYRSGAGSVRVPEADYVSCDSVEIPSRAGRAVDPYPPVHTSRSSEDSRRGLIQPVIGNRPVCITGLDIDPGCDCVYARNKEVEDVVAVDDVGLIDGISIGGGANRLKGLDRQVAASRTDVVVGNSVEAVAHAARCGAEQNRSAGKRHSVQRGAAERTVRYGVILGAVDEADGAGACRVACARVRNRQRVAACSHAINGHTVGAVQINQGRDEGAGDRARSGRQHQESAEG